MKLWLLALVACGKSETHEPPKPPPEPVAEKPSAPPPSGKPQIKDKTVEAMILKGSACKPDYQNVLPMECAELKAIHEYAFQNQNNADTAETCVAFFTDPDRVRRLLAAECIYGLNSATDTPILHWGLDAVEAEKDPAVVERMTWGLSNAEAPIAKLDDRVLADVEKLTADPKTAQAAAWLFGAEFKSYLMQEGPKAPPQAQARAVKALTEDGTPMMHAAFNVALEKLEDKPAVCAAIDQDLDPKFKAWSMAADAIPTLKDACVTKVQKAIDLMLAQLAKDPHIDLLMRYDNRFELDPDVRKKILATVKSVKLESWQQDAQKKAIAQFSAPPKPKK
ncbi:MAG: hypothetical protein QM831_18355 [Kofleriaceae bacterium]